MGTVAKYHFNNIINDDTMDAMLIQELINMLQDHIESGEV